jgi:photosystem II stability/assembly factor-like uncharacterized protein
MLIYRQLPSRSYTAKVFRLVRLELLARLLACVTLCSCIASAQWVLQESPTTADLRGIDALNEKVAWASGTQGTILRTTDGGQHWQICATPFDAGNLDFRSIQAFDASTAIVMSSGAGSLSRLYKTTDNCRSWRLILTNSDRDGFWDAVKFTTGEKTRPYRTGVLYGDPVRGKFVEFLTYDFGENWTRSKEVPDARPGEGLFAASNSALLYGSVGTLIVTGGASGSRSRTEQYNFQHDPYVPYRFVGADIPLANSKTAGAFSVATSLVGDAPFRAKQKWVGGVYGLPVTLVAVGGDFQYLEISKGTAAFTEDGGQHWTAATKSPRGYRSSVVYDDQAKLWIAVGPNGTDISTDNGRNWGALVPDGAIHEPSNVDRNWNAISLPFVVGPHGRIGKLRPGALQH